MTALITYLFEVATTIIAFWVCILLFSQRKTSQIPLGNLFLALGAGFLGVFTATTVVYSLIGQASIIILFLKMGMIANMAGVFMLYCTMLILIYSSAAFQTKRLFFLIPGFLGAVIAGVLIIAEYILVIDAATAETEFLLLPFLLYAAYICVMLLSSAVMLYGVGIRKNSGDARTRMRFFFACILAFIGGMIVDAIGNFVTMEDVTDTLLFAFLAVGILLGAVPFQQKRKTTQ